MSLTPRPLDHVVLPVSDIATARARLTALGFTVAADARHPFGTENACVFFADKTYLEPLGIADAEQCAASARSGNQFTARNNAFRFRCGADGLSSIAMGSTDADRDDAAFRTAGFSGGDMLEFSRPMKLPDGSELTARFKLSFAVDLRSPDFHGFTCQRINMPAADRSALERHANGATGILMVVLSEPQPEDFADYLAAIVGGASTASDHEGIDFQTANAKIRVLNDDGLRAFNGDKPDPARRGLKGEGLVFRVENLDTTESLLKTNGISYNRIGRSVVVQSAPGQGVPIVFFAE
jgi:hypothetical protein